MPLPLKNKKEEDSIASACFFNSPVIAACKELGAGEQHLWVSFRKV